MKIYDWDIKQHHIQLINESINHWMIQSINQIINLVLPCSIPTTIHEKKLIDRNIPVESKSWLVPCAVREEWTCWIAQNNHRKKKSTSDYDNIVKRITTGVGLQQVLDYTGVGLHRCRIRQVSDYTGVGLHRCRITQVSDYTGAGLNRSYCNDAMYT